MMEVKRSSSHPIKSSLHRRLLITRRLLKSRRSLRSKRRSFKTSFKRKRKPDWYSNAAKLERLRL